MTANAPQTAHVHRAVVTTALFPCTGGDFFIDDQGLSIATAMGAGAVVVGSVYSTQPREWLTGSGATYGPVSFISLPATDSEDQRA